MSQTRQVRVRRGTLRLRPDGGQDGFRREFVAFLVEHAPSGDEMRADPPRSTGDLPAWARRWVRTLFDHGWLVPGWLPEHGGRNATPAEQLVYLEEFARHPAPRTTAPQSLATVAPALMQFGSAEQQANYALPLLRGEQTACIGMSEPGAGSDLASLSTRATLDGDHFVVQGQKVWTSGAQHADFCFCLVRTDAEAPKRRGISVLLIDLASPGLTVRPIRQITGPSDFNEVFLDGVIVPASNLVGGLNDGWRVSQGSLAHERSMMWTDTAAELDLSCLALASQLAAAGDQRREWGLEEVLADAVAQCYVDSRALQCMGHRSMRPSVQREGLPVHSVLKVFASEARQRLAGVAMEWLGPAAFDASLPASGPRLRNDPGGPTPSWANRYLQSFSSTIAGGANEIHRNIIAEQILGLPRG